MWIYRAKLGIDRAGCRFCFRERLARDAWKVQDFSLKVDGQIALMCKLIKYRKNEERKLERTHWGGKISFKLF